MMISLSITDDRSRLTQCHDSVGAVLSATVLRIPARRHHRRHASASGPGQAEALPLVDGWGLPVSIPGVTGG